MVGNVLHRRLLTFDLKYLMTNLGFEFCTRRNHACCKQREILSVPKLLHLSTLFLDNCFGVPQRKDYITEMVLEIFFGAIILTGDLSDFRTVISGKVGLWEN